MFNLIEKNKIGFSSKGHITKQELAKCFIDAISSMVASGVITVGLFQQLILEMKWLFLSLYGLIFLATFIYKIIEKISRDGNQINYDIHKEVLDQSIKENEV